MDFISAASLNHWAPYLDAILPATPLWTGELAVGGRMAQQSHGGRSHPKGTHLHHLITYHPIEGYGCTCNPHPVGVWTASRTGAGREPRGSPAPS